MNLPCRMCERPVKVSVMTWLGGGPVFCPPDEVGTCIAVFTAANCSPPDEDDEPHPDSIPPEDIHVCPVCGGAGEVVFRRDWQTGAYETTSCIPCGGSGEVTPQWAAPELTR